MTKQPTRRGLEVTSRWWQDETQMDRWPPIGGALATLGVWLASATPLLETRNLPLLGRFRGDLLFYASLTFLPLALSALVGAIRGNALGLERARLHLLYAGLLASFVVFACLFFSFVKFVVA